MDKASWEVILGHTEEETYCEVRSLRNADSADMDQIRIADEGQTAYLLLCKLNQLIIPPAESLDSQPRGFQSSKKLAGE